MNPQSRTEVVYFAKRDYAGLLRRLAVEAIDLLVVFALIFAATVLLVLASHPDPLRPGPVLLAWGVVLYWYFVVLKHTRWLTAGYRLCGVRIVNASGQAPGLVSLSARLLFGFLGPFNFLLDMLWIPSDPWHQSLRDKLAHTYVVKANAKPAGPGHVVYPYYCIMGSTFIFQDVEPGKAPDAP